MGWAHLSAHRSGFNEPHWLLKLPGFAGGLKVFVVESEGRDFQRTRSGDAVLELWSCLSGSTRVRRIWKLKSGASDLEVLSVNNKVGHIGSGYVRPQLSGI